MIIIKTAEIYIITNLINGRQYVGQTVKGYLNRFKGHCILYNRCKFRGEQMTAKTHIDEAIAYYGVENFTVELLEVVPFDKKYEKEQYYIEKYDTYNNGYNYTIGGDVNPMYNDKTRQHHKQIMSSLEVRSKISKGVRKSLTPELVEWFRQHGIDMWNNFTEDKKLRCTEQFRRYNNSKKQRVAMIDSKGKIIKIFECASDACAYFNKPRKEAGHLLLACDRFNKNGTRCKFYNNYWIKL